MLKAVAEARSVQRRMRSLAKLNLELAKVEAQKKATGMGIAGGLAVGAGVIVLYAIGFLFAAAAAGLSLSLPLWASLLIVAGIMILTAGILVFLAMRIVKKTWPPKPAQAIEEGERTIETVKSHL